MVQLLFFFFFFCSLLIVSVFCGDIKFIKFGLSQQLIIVYEWVPDPNVLKDH